MRGGGGSDLLIQSGTDYYDLGDYSSQPYKTITFAEEFEDPPIIMLQSSGNPEANYDITVYTTNSTPSAPVTITYVLYRYVTENDFKFKAYSINHGNQKYTKNYITWLAIGKKKQNP